MRAQQFPKRAWTAVLFAGSIAIISCGPATNKAPELPQIPIAPTEKPESVNSVHVGITEFTELSHIERAIKPFIGVKIANTPPVSGASDLNCRTTEASKLALWETTWKCGLDPKVRGRKEVEGVERVNYDAQTRELTYSGDFEIRNFDDLEPVTQAHVLVTSRKIKIRFDLASTDKVGRATVTMTSTAGLKGAINSKFKGSNYQSSFSGILLHQDANWTLTNDSVLQFDGALFGLDGERLTKWASGKYKFVPQSPIKLVGLGEEKCTLAVGRWNLTAVGGGKNFDTTMETSEAGGAEAGGSVLNWPNSLCDQP